VDGAPYITNRCVEMCMYFVCSGHCCSHHKLEVQILSDRWSSSLHAVTIGRLGTVVRKVCICTTAGAQPALRTGDRSHCFMP